MVDLFRITPKKRTVLLRKNKGVIYNNPGLLSRSIFWLGNFLLLLSMGYVVFLYYPLANSLIQYYKNHKLNFTKTFENSDQPTIAEKEKSAENFVLNIPKIGANVEVISNVSIFDKNIYKEVLKNNQVAHTSGTYFPGDGKGTSSFLFAHSSFEGISMVRNNTIFYLLGELDSGDEFWVDYNGERFVYKVYEKKVVGAADTKYLTYSDPKREVMILQTCWPIGTDWRRLLVLGELKK